MNKKFIYTVSVMVLLFFSSNSYSQTATIDLQIFPITEMDLGSLLVENNIQGARPFFSVQITPAGQNVYVKGEVKWDKKDGRGFQSMFTFQTEPFISRNFLSSELGSSGLRIAPGSQFNSTLTKELVERGKPTGSFQFILQLYSANGTYLSQSSQELSFQNPSQTLTIITPDANSTQSVGSIIARWSQINGASKYKIKLNLRTAPGQSLEEALESGTPLINNKEVDGSVTNADLRSLLEREWLPGQELVLQVTAVAAGLAGGTELRSQIINFQIAQGSGTPVDNAKNALIALLTQLQNEQATLFVSELNNASMDNVKYYNNEGSEISFAQFQSIVNSILSSIVKITLTNQ